MAARRVELRRVVAPGFAVLVIVGAAWGSSVLGSGVRPAATCGYGYGYTCPAARTAPSTTVLHPSKP